MIYVIKNNKNEKIAENCLDTINNYYVGCETGTHYDKEKYFIVEITKVPFIIFKNNHSGINERCVNYDKDNFKGITTGNLYSKKEHYVRKQFEAILSEPDNKNMTGMLHLSGDDEEMEENNYSFKRKFVGAKCTVNKAHLCDGLKIYVVEELRDYFSENELHINAEITE